MPVFAVHVCGVNVHWEEVYTLSVDVSFKAFAKEAELKNIFIIIERQQITTEVVKKHANILCSRVGLCFSPVTTTITMKTCLTT